MANNESVSALARNATFPETLNPVTDVSNWSASDFFARYGRLLHAHQFAGMFLDD